MPNWCSTQITINCDNQEKLQKLYNNIKKWTSTNYKENDFGLTWLGNIVGNSGIGTVGEDLRTDLRCRGWITYLEIVEDQILIDTETAWEPMLDMWFELLKKHLPDAELIYRAEEPGCDIDHTNDPVLEDKYWIDIWGDDLTEEFIPDNAASKEDVVKTLQKLFQTKEQDFDTLMKKWSKSDYIDSLQIHKWQFIDIDEL